MTDNDKLDQLAKFAGLRKWVSSKGIVAKFYVNERGREVCPVADWNPSSNPAQWWMLLLALEQKGYLWELWSDPQKDGTTQYGCVLTNVETGRKMCLVVEKQAGQAVCNAAFRRKLVEEETCAWAEETNDDYDCWTTECGNRFEIIDGTPGENRMKFCPYCGGKINELD